MERWRIVKAFTMGPLLEAAVPKPGNVNRFADFEDLTVYHFIAANTAVLPVYHEAAKTGELLRRGLLAPNEARIGELVRRAVEGSRSVQDANPNFGVITLSIPLIMGLSMARDVMEGREKAKLLLRESTVRDAMEFYRAIRTAGPKGLPREVEYDVYSDDSFRKLFADRVNLWKLAEISCGRELVFCEWLDDYSLSYKTADRLMKLLGELPFEEAVARTFVELMAKREDTLIARKAGHREAELVRRKAAEVLAGRLKLEELDAFLRERGDLRNPGSLADVVAISLSLLALSGLKFSTRRGRVFGLIG
ncbi:triphosphoribosyl-dephospho-CoA synthase [Thermococcus sp.]